jgi:hypothetical protein
MRQEVPLRRSQGVSPSSGVALRAGPDLLGYDLAGGVFAPATASADGKLALHFEQGARAAVHGLANLSITYCIADADVHPLDPLDAGRVRGGPPQEE